MSPCQGAYAHGGACRTDEDRAGAGAYCPIHSMVREPYDCIIGDALIRAIPLGRVATARGSLRRHAYTAMVEAMMSRRKNSAKPAGLSQLNLNAAGIDVGAPAISSRCPPTVRSSRYKSLPPSQRTCIAWRSGCPSAVWRPWSWSRRGCTGYRCSGCWKSEASR